MKIQSFKLRLMAFCLAGAACHGPSIFAQSTTSDAPISESAVTEAAENTPETTPRSDRRRRGTLRARLRRECLKDDKTLAGKPLETCITQKRKTLIEKLKQ
jgi:hypothetical protein